MLRQLGHLTVPVWIFACACHLPPPHCRRPQPIHTRGRCLWPFGDSRFCHICSSCDGNHPRVCCTFLSPATNRSRSHSPVQPPTVFPVNSAWTVPVRPDHPCGLPCSAASFCSSSVDSHDMSVPARSFSPLAPVHLVCPLQFSQFQAELVDYPDRAAAAYVLNNLHNGICISLEALSVSLQSASSNMRHAFDHASVIDAYLATEVLCVWVAGPSTAVCRFNLHISLFGVVPKSNQPRKWCFILDLASPDGHSVNDGISKTLFSL